MIAAAIRFARRLAHETRALGAVEFAMTAPFLILLYIGGFQLMDAISAYRKVTITTRSLADLTSRQETMTDAKATEFMNAARQVMAPYSTANVDMRITQIYIPDDQVPKLAWTRTSNDDDAALEDKDITVPDTMRVKDTFLIQASVVYHYTPVVGGKLIGPMTFSDTIYMNPRRTDSIPMDGACSLPLCQVVDLTEAS